MASTAGAQRAWVVAIGRPEVGYAWEAGGLRVECAFDGKPSVDETDASPRAGALTHYGAPPGEVGHELLSADELGERLGCELVSTLVLDSPILLRNLPLRLMALEAVEQLPTGADGEAVRAGLRTRQPHADLFVRPVKCAGHGLFAASAIPAHALLGEYVGVLTSASGFAQRGALDAYVCAYPAAELCVTADKIGGLMRTLNHAPAPVANVSMVPVMVDGAYHLALLTRTAVGKGSQLLLDYGRGYWAVRDVQQLRLDAAGVDKCLRGSGTGAGEAVERTPDDEADGDAACG
jgi:hypothetical protein